MCYRALRFTSVLGVNEVLLRVQRTRSQLSSGPSSQHWWVGRVTWELISRNFGLGFKEGGVWESPFPPGWHIHVYIRNEDKVNLAS